MAPANSDKLGPPRTWLVRRSRETQSSDLPSLSCSGMQTQTQDHQSAGPSSSPVEIAQPQLIDSEFLEALRPSTFLSQSNRYSNPETRDDRVGNVLCGAAQVYVIGDMLPGRT